MEAKTNQILAIDIVRFSCALMVLGFHYTYLFPLAADSVPSLFNPRIALPIEGARFGWFGWVGVEIFFVVSGYVIAYSGAEVPSPVFLRRRMLRLAPAAWLCSSVAALLLLIGTATPAGNILLRWVAAISFIQFTKPIDASYWTLSVELMFYLLVSTRLRASGNAPRIERLVLAIGGASVAFWIFVYATAISSEVALDNTTLIVSLLPHGVFFALGALLQGRRNGEPSRWRTPALAIFLAGAFAEVAFHAGSMRDVTLIDPNPVEPMIVFAAAIAAIALADRLQKPLGRLGAARLAKLGLMTYPLYLLHQTAGAAMIAALMAMGVSAWPAIALTALGVIALAYAVTNWFEPPVRNWLARVSAPRAPLLNTVRTLSPRSG